MRWLWVLLAVGCGDDRAAPIDGGVPPVPDAPAIDVPSPDMGDAGDTTNTTDLVEGIGTQVDDAYAYPGKPAGDPKTPIATSVSAVFYHPPVMVQRGDLVYWEVTGTIRGVGWGGYTELVENNVTLFVGENQAHYDYEVSFVLRWNPDWNGVLDFYNHGGWLLSTVQLAESYAGDGGLDDAIHLEREGDTLVSDSVLGDARKHAFFAMSSLLKADGTPAAFATEGPYAGRPVAFCGDSATARDTAQVAKRLIAKLTGRPVVLTIGMGHSFGAIRMRNVNLGSSTYLEGVARTTLAFSRAAGGDAGTIPAGTAVTNDDESIVFLTSDDVAVAAGATGPFTVLAEASLPGPPGNVDADTMTTLASDVFDPMLTVTNPAAAAGGSAVPARTGDVHERAYDQSSPNIFDGMLLYAYGCAPDPDPAGIGSCVVDPDHPLGVPMSVIRGELEGTLDDVRLVAQLAGAGADVAGSVRAYEVRNLPHDWDEIWQGTPNLSAALSALGTGDVAHAGRMAPVVAALLDDMIAHLQQGTALLPGRIDGVVAPTGDHDAVIFSRALRTPLSPTETLTTDQIPFADDPTLDTVPPELQTDTSGYVDLFDAALAAMPHESGPILLPETACRAGTMALYADDALDGWYTPFPDLLAVWSTQAAYDSCVNEAKATLIQDGLYTEE